MIEIKEEAADFIGMNEDFEPTALENVFVCKTTGQVAMVGADRTLIIGSRMAMPKA